MRAIAIAIGISFVLVTGAAAQLWLLSPASQGGGGAAVPTTPCGAGQLDFSDATGCNLVWAGH